MFVNRCFFILVILKLSKILTQLFAAGIALDVQKYSDFRRNKVVKFYEMADCDYHNTLCMTHTEKICHEHCGLRETTTQGDDVFRGCACMMGRGNCAIC